VKSGNGTGPTVVLDACVLYPTVMRQILLGSAGAGLFTPLWSARILEEWARAAARHGADQGAGARGEIAVLHSRWPHAAVPVLPDQLAPLSLPDPDDIHVLGAAIAGDASLIVTMNLKDFPRRVLAGHGLQPMHPDAFLRGLFADAPDAVADVVREVRAEAERLSQQSWPVRKLLKKARLPRLGKALETADSAS